MTKNQRRNTMSAVLTAILWSPLIWWLVGCATAPSPRVQVVIDVLCLGDALAQPVIIPVVLLIAPATGAAAPAVAVGVAVDTALVHPAVVAACARYGSKPVGMIPISGP